MITSLPFDSSLFGYPVGQCQVEKYWDETTFLEEAKAFQLVHLFSETELPVRSNPLRLVDVKATFSKDLVKNPQQTNGIYRWEGELDGSLIDLALESGSFSRFKTDPRLVQGEFEKLYQVWIEKAWEKKEIFCTLHQEAMVTVSVEGKLAKIGLLAVDAAHRGLGWGRKLVHAAEHHALLSGANQMQISTQLTNLPACRLYYSVGYHLADRWYSYHWWK